MKGSSGRNRLGVDLPTSAGTQGSREDEEARRVRTKIGGGGGSCVRSSKWWKDWREGEHEPRPERHISQHDIMRHTYDSELHSVRDTTPTLRLRPP
jgi:hypothetical protein